MKGRKIERAKDFKGSMIRFFKELNSFRLLIIVAITVSVASSILSICTPNILSNLTDTIREGLMVNTNNIETITNNIKDNSMKKITIDNIVITTEDQMKFIEVMSSDKNIDKLPDNIKKVVEPKMNLDKVKRIFLLILSLYLISALFNYIETVSMADVSNNFAKKLRSDISIKINKLPLKYFDRSSTGDVLSRMTNDVDTMAQSMNNSLASLVSALTLFIGTTIMMFITNVVMATTAIVSSLIGFAFMALLLSKSQKYFEARQIELGKLNGHIEEIYSGLNVVKAYNGKEEVNKVFDELNNNLYNANRMTHFLGGLMRPMMHLVGNLGYVAVCIVGALLTMNNAITFGVIVAFMLYVRLFIAPLNEIAQSMTSIQSTAAAIERVYEFMDEEELEEENNITKHLDKNKVKGNIEFNNVIFKYDSNDKPTIKNFSAKVSSGQKVAIVGPTGAGKTTMVNLLMKFYNLTDGDIKIDGISIKDLTRENIRELFTMVLQDTWVYEGTIKDNIRYNNDVSDNKIEEICKIVGLDHFIRTLPNSYDSLLTNTDMISAGQRQLLTIARGMIKDAPFLILDEATSNVDTRTEELVQKAMDKLTEGKTSFIIAHRLSTIKNADLILVMQDGNIVEQGNHNELMKLNKFYAKLYNSQFEL